MFRHISQQGEKHIWILYMKVSKNPFCKKCGHEITEKIFLAISSVQKTRGVYEWEMQGDQRHYWINRHSEYYHPDCFSELAGEDLTQRVVSPPLEDIDFLKMCKKAGV
jgi:hypothetical protein